MQWSRRERAFDAANDEKRNRVRRANGAVEGYGSENEKLQVNTCRSEARRYKIKIFWRKVKCQANAVRRDFLRLAALPAILLFLRESELCEDAICELLDEVVD
jgi:hypothetical protein